MNIYSKLMQARMAIQSREIKKSGRNTFAGYNYMELGDFLPAAQTVFAELGLCGIVSFTADTASLTIIDTEDGSQHVITSPMGSAALKGCHEVQNIGAVETYQRRYLWMAALELVEHDAIDASEGASAKPPKKDAKPAGPPPGSAAQAKKDAFDDLQPEVQDALRRVAQNVTAAMPDGAKARDILLMGIEEWPAEDAQQLKVAAWHLLDSRTRAAIKQVEAH